MLIINLCKTLGNLFTFRVSSQNVLVPVLNCLIVGYVLFMMFLNQVCISIDVRGGMLHFSILETIIIQIPLRSIFVHIFLLFFSFYLCHILFNSM